jgi:hypothetical protein
VWVSTHRVLLASSNTAHCRWRDRRL